MTTIVHPRCQEPGCGWAARRGLDYCGEHLSRVAEQLAEAQATMAVLTDGGPEFEKWLDDEVAFELVLERLRLGRLARELLADKQWIVKAGDHRPSCIDCDSYADEGHAEGCRVAEVLAE